MTTAYDDLEQRFRRLAHIEGALGVLHWDSATMMPAGGADGRAEQIATLSELHHEGISHPAIPDLVADAEAEVPAGDEWRRANLREMMRRWRHAAAVPGRLVAARSRAASACEMLWREARPADDFAAVAGKLAAVVALTREVAAAKAAALDVAAYDALLDQYDPELRAADVDVLFADLEAFLPDALAGVLARQAGVEAQAPDGPFPVAAQRALAETLLDALHFDRRHGRLDESRHPFTGGVPQDVRITTRYDEADFGSGMMAVLHEGGHATYERNLPAAWLDQPVGQARGMTLHESQSLLVERYAGLSDEFFGYFAPLARRAFAGDGPAWAPGNMARLFRRVEPGFIRVDADLVTYPAHVILRYRLERALLAGELEVDGLPAAWHDGMIRLLGIAPHNDRLGCLQDIHWYGGDFGYFPTYTLGALAAAQLHEAALRARPDIPERIAAGDFGPLIDWLRVNVHAFGALHSTQELLERVTGSRLATAAYKRHVAGRYLA